MAVSKEELKKALKALEIALYAEKNGLSSVNSGSPPKPALSIKLKTS